MVIKVKKSLSFFVILLFLLTNISYAQSQAESSAVTISASARDLPSCDIGLCKAYICCSSEGVEPCPLGFPQQCSSCSKDICLSGQTSSGSSGSAQSQEQIKQKVISSGSIMDLYSRGEVSEDDLRSMARKKMGDKFSEEKFQKNLMEQKEKMDRKDSFSYENEGVGHRYDAGPSYEGYSKEQIIFSVVFEQIGNDIDPRDIKEHCSDPDKIADTIVSKLREKVGDVKNLCSRFESSESKCDDESKIMCSKIGTEAYGENANDVEKAQAAASACPVNKEDIIKACRLKNMRYLEQQIKNIDESCQKGANFDKERTEKECERLKQYQVCDKEKYMQQCMNNLGAKKENFDESGERKQVCPKYPVPACENGTRLETRTDANGCQYYYCIQPSQCPTQTQPACKEGETLQKKSDGKGCVYYYCSLTELKACTAEAQQCPDGSFVSRDPANNCSFRPCPSPTTISKCPEPAVPSCPSGTTIQKKTDDRGCVYYYCSEPACQSVAKPACSEGQILKTRYEQNGCVFYECVSVASNSNSSGITGAVVVSTYDDYLKQCESNWMQQEKVCQNMQSSCDKTNFVEKCKEQSKKNYEDFKSRVELNCKSETVSQINAAEDRCPRISDERKRCAEETAKRCERTKGLSQQCREILAEDSLRKFIIEEAKKRCNFKDIIQNEDDVKKENKAEIILAVLNAATKEDLDKLKLFVDSLKEDLKLQDTTVFRGTIDPNRFGDIKLLPFVVNAKLSTSVSSEMAKEVKENIVASQKTQEAAGKLASLRDSDVPAQYLYIIEDKANDVLNVSGNLQDIEKKEEQKGVGYKIRLFLGLAKKAEQEEINKLEDSKSKLANSTDALAKIIDEVQSDIAKAILKEQVESLKKQQEDIDSLIKAKEKKAKGLLGIFG